MTIQVDPVLDKVPQTKPVVAVLKKPSPTVRPDLNKIEAVGSPWWSAAPDIIQKCLTLIFAPFKLLATLLDMLVSAVFLSIFVIIGLWWFGYISDASISQFIEILGNRIIGIVQKTGVL